MAQAPVIKTKYTAQDFANKMRRFSAQYGVELGTVLRSQMALWALSLIKHTYPKQIRLGQKATKIGIDAAIKPLGRFDATWERDGKVWFRWGKKHVQPFDPSEVDLTSSIERMRAWHNNARNSYGRVRRGTKQLRVRSAAAANIYAREVVSHVWRTKSGWLAGAEHFLARADSRIVTGKVDPRVARHRNWAYGNGYTLTSDSLPRNCDPLKTVNGSVEAGSAVPWARDTDGLMAFTLRLRIRDLEKWMAVRMQKAADAARRAA